MTRLATKDFLDEISDLYPTSNLKSSTPIETILDNKWYFIAAVAFSASNTPEEIPHVFKYAMEKLADAHSQSKTETSQVHRDQLALARRFREPLCISGITSGFARCINGCVALHEVMPDDLKDTEMSRDTSTPVEKLEARGKRVFQAMYGETADSVQGLMDSAYPDLGYFCNTYAYGFMYGHNSILSQVEMSCTMIASLIATDTPRQVGWHMATAQRGGATLEEVRAVRLIAMKVAEKTGVKWKAGVPHVHFVELQ